MLFIDEEPPEPPVRHEAFVLAQMDATEDNWAHGNTWFLCTLTVLLAMGADYLL